MAGLDDVIELDSDINKTFTNFWNLNLLFFMHATAKCHIRIRKARTADFQIQFKSKAEQKRGS